MNMQSEFVQITKDNAVQAFTDGDAKEQALLIRLFGKKVFITDRMELIDSFEAACEFNNTNPADRKFTQGTEAGNNMEMLAEIAKALNGGKIMQPNEKRYYPYFRHDESGFRFYVVYFAFTGSNSFGGPRLCCAEERHAKYMGTKFLPLYNHFYNPAQ